MQHKARTYMGCSITPCTGHTPYWRYEAYIEGHGFVYGSTLVRMIDLIRHYKGGK